MTSDARARTIVADRYELHERVGQGGCGVVYRATDRHTGHSVAVKMLSRSTRQDPSFVERLVREQQALQALAGTHAVGAIDLCRAGTGELCLVMEWLEGTDLEQRLTELEKLGTPLGTEELWRVLEPVLQTLEKAHELGIVHRDVKPANIFLLSEDRGVRLLDFGFSRLKSSATLTAADTVMGSPSYIAPEAWQHGSKAIEKQADLYAAGVIAFRALAGRVPFEGASLVETMQLVTTAPRPSLCALRPDLPPVVDVWVEHALAVDPARRFQHAQSFLDALAAALRGVELPAHTLPAASRHPETAPPPKTTPGERQNALSFALGRAASLLKRVASSLSRSPASAVEGSPTEDTREAVHEHPAPTPGAQPALLAPPPPRAAAPPRPKPALIPRVREAEADLLIAELLPPSLPPPAPLAGELEALEPLAPSRTIAIEAPAEPTLTPPPPAPSPATPPPAAPPPAAPLASTSPPPPLEAPAVARASKKTPVKRKSRPKRGTAAAHKAPQRTTARPSATTAVETSNSTRASERPDATPAQRARPSSAPAPARSKKQAPKRSAAKRASSDQSTTPTTPKRRTQKTTVDAVSPKPKARKRAKPQAASAKRTPPEPTAKSSRTKSGRVAGAQASKRTST